MKISKLEIIVMLVPVGIFVCFAASGLLYNQHRTTSALNRNRDIVLETARRLEMSPQLLLAVAETESSFNPEAVSHKGAVGIMQVMPSTAAEVANKLGLPDLDLFDPKDNTLIGGTYLKQLAKRYRDDMHLALAAYVAGPGRVDSWNTGGNGLPGPEVVEMFADDETRAYVSKVLEIADLDTDSLQRHAWTVSKGDTLSHIAEQTGVSVKNIIRLNDNLSGNNRIYPGQTLRLTPLSNNTKQGSGKILIYKSKRKLQLSVGDHLLKEYDIGLGQDPVRDKEREGDSRTPEGTFYVCQRLANGQYGCSLGLSYPNDEDAKRGLNTGLISRKQYDDILKKIRSKKKPPWNTPLGGAICIHGRGNSRDWTAGCIALDDEDANELFAMTEMGITVKVLP
jgi:hypothetical protein